MAGRPGPRASDRSPGPRPSACATDRGPRGSEPRVRHRPRHPLRSRSPRPQPPARPRSPTPRARGRAAPPGPVGPRTPSARVAQCDAPAPPIAPGNRGTPGGAAGDGGEACSTRSVPGERAAPAAQNPGPVPPRMPDRTPCPAPLALGLPDRPPPSRDSRLTPHPHPQDSRRPPESKNYSSLELQTFHPTPDPPTPPPVHTARCPRGPTPDSQLPRLELQPCPPLQSSGAQTHPCKSRLADPPRPPPPRS